MDTSVDAVILGGGTIKRPDGEAASGPADMAGKGLLKLGNREMIEYIIDALQGVKTLRRIIIVAPEPALHESWAERVDAVIPTVGSAVENAVAGLQYLKASDSGMPKYVLVMTCDIPLVTAEAINDFLERCSAADNDVYYPVILKEVVEAKYPETKRTYASLKDGTVTGGNFALLEPEIILANLDLLEQVYASRKSVFKIFRILGPKIIVKFILKRLALSDLEARVATIVKAKIKVIITPYPEIGIDVDKQEDLELVNKVLATA